MMHYLSELKGQSIASRILEYYLTHPLPPLLIFHGPDGTGKLSSAEVFIKQKLCKVGTGCGSCVPCRKMAKEEYVDYIRFPEEKILIGDQEKPEQFTVRWLTNTYIRFTPFEGDTRFVLFPRGELIQHEAETALLKTLEEPPEHTRFILLVNDLSRLKETIISRGVQIPFNYLPVDKIQSIIPGDSSDFIDMLGGSFHLVPFFQTELYRRMKLAIQEAFQHPLNILDLEKWILSGEKNGFSDLTGGQDFSYYEILDYFGLILMHMAYDQNLNHDIQQEIFKFKRELHREQQGMHPYILARLFHSLTGVLEKADV